MSTVVKSLTMPTGNANFDDRARDCCEDESTFQSAQSFLDVVSTAPRRHFAVLSSTLRAIGLLQTVLAQTQNPPPIQGFHPLNLARQRGTLTTYSSDTIEVVDITRCLSIAGGGRIANEVNMFCGSVVLYSAMGRDGNVHTAFLTGEDTFRHIARQFGSPTNVLGVVYDNAFERRIRAGVVTSLVIDPSERTRCLAQLANVIAASGYCLTRDVVVSVTWSITRDSYVADVIPRALLLRFAVQSFEDSYEGDDVA